MIRSYIQTAIRVLLKRKLYSFINAFGLSLSIAACLFIFLYIRDENSFDKFHTNKNLVFRIEDKIFNMDNPGAMDPYTRSASLPAGLKQALKDELPEISHATRFNSGYGNVLRYEDKLFRESLTYVDKDFFEMFSFRLIAGNSEKLFLTKEEVVLTPEVAKKYFGDNDPIGKAILIGSDQPRPFTVTGVIERPPFNSSLDFSILIPQENRSNYEQLLTKWTDTNSPTFVQLIPGTNLETFDRNLMKVMRKYQGDRLERWEKARREATFPIGPDITLVKLDFTALPDMHLKKETEWFKVSDPVYSYILGGVAVLILIISCVNYISLALTTSTSRFREVGIRKVVGALKSQLIRQFAMESIVLAFLSLAGGMAIVVLALQSFNEFTARDIHLQGTDLVLFAGVGVTLAIVIGLLAGSYPAVFLSRFRAAMVLKGYTTSRVQLTVTRPLVVIQFTLSSLLIISAVVMNEQMKFIASKDLGYDKEQVLVMSTQTGWNEESNRVVERFRIASQKVPGVISVSGASGSFGYGTWRHDFKYNDQEHTAYLYAVDPYYIQTLGIELVNGRNFDASIASDSNALIVNEALVKALGWKDPIGEYLHWNSKDTGLGDKVIGVVKDYHILPLDHELAPVILSMNKRKVGYLITMLVKINPNDIPNTIAAVQSAWKEAARDKPFTYGFLDDNVTRQYKVYDQWTDIMTLASGVAVVIACLGLFGLSGVNAMNRTKEIGIRKVMGAGITSIFVLLNRQYVILAAIAFVIAAPLAWYGVDRWLSEFSYRVTVGWELLATCMIAGLTIALMTASFHAIKVSLRNPADTLRHE